MLSFYIYIYNY